MTACVRATQHGASAVDPSPAAVTCSIGETLDCAADNVRQRRRSSHGRRAGHSCGDMLGFGSNRSLATRHRAQTAMALREPSTPSRKLPRSRDQLPLIGPARRSVELALDRGGDISEAPTAVIVEALESSSTSMAIDHALHEPVTASAEASSTSGDEFRGTCIRAVDRSHCEGVGVSGRTGNAGVRSNPRRHAMAARCATDADLRMCRAASAIGRRDHQPCLRGLARATSAAAFRNGDSDGPSA